ncbi:MAG: hypothetical protein Fur0035_22260 [Anaerolineales bacterium]
MAIWKGKIARWVMLMFAILAVIALGMAYMVFRYALRADQTQQKIDRRADLALLSSQIRSESLLLTGMIQRYTLNGVSPSVGRQEIISQLKKLDGLVQQAQARIDPSDVDENLQVGEVYQLLIGFDAQAKRVLDAFDQEKNYGALTQASVAILIEHYQLPLIDALRRFEKLETQKSDELRQKLQEETRRDTTILALIAVSIIFAVLMMTRLITVRFIGPLAVLNRGVETLRAGKMNQPIALRQPDEIGELASAINSMAADLEESRRQLQEYAQTLEQQVRERGAEARKLFTAIEQSPSLVLITDTRGIIEYVNPSFKKITGYSAEECLGKNPRLVKSGETSAEKYVELWQALKDGQVWRGEFHNRKKNGELYWVLAVVSPIRDEAGEITHYVAVQQDITARKQAEEELRLWAITDSLTGLYNRRQLFLLAEQAQREQRRAHQPLAALMMDVDHFKKVNDVYGHSIGDMILQNVADLLQKQLRQADILGRYGGEEFAIILPNTRAEMALQIAERIREHISRMSVPSTQGPVSVTISIGITIKDGEQAISVEKLFDLADQALYQAKQSGRNRVVLLNPSSQSIS